MANEEKIKSGFGTASLVLSIIAICTSFLPIINNMSFMLAILAIIFSIVSLAKKASKGMAICGIIISIIACVAVVNSQKLFVETIDTAINEFNDNVSTMTGEKTDEVLANNVDVTIGDFSAKKGSYGMTETKLPVTVKNKSSERKSFSIQIEAINSDGSRITNDYIYANDLGAGQSQDFKLFEYVESDKVESLKNATFKIVGVSMY